MNTIDPIKRTMEEPIRAYEKFMRDALMSDNELLNDVLSYIQSKKGKQLRPLLVLLSAKICSQITEKTIATAAALELLHTASLVHDDVVDSSAKRRGADAIHTRWNNKVAILVGDYLLAKVISIITEIRNGKILDIVSELGCTLSSGELLQLHANQSMWISEEQYFKVIEQKTAKLFEACMEAGAESTGATPRQRAALKRYGHELGICFQLKDDVFDYSDLEDIGKPTMSDIKDGKATLPLIISLARAPKEEADRIRTIAEELYARDSRINVNRAEQEIKSFVLRYQGVEYAQSRMQQHKKLATEALEVFRDQTAKEQLLTIVDYAINRLR